MISNKKILIFGGTGSLGRVLTRRLLALRNSLFIFSRDEAKHHYMRLEFPQEKELNLTIGDIRDKEKVYKTIRDIQPDIIINAAAMKQVPACEFFPEEALLTNTIGTKNLVECCDELLVGCKILSVSTDKAAKPVNTYGMTKAIQERIHLNGKNNTYNCVRYGNVLESTGSVIPFFKQKIANKEDLPITHKDMTRFLMSLDESVSLIMRALQDEVGGIVFVPKIRSARVIDLAEIMLEGSNLSYTITRIRPGEKVHEILISEEEIGRTSVIGGTYEHFVVKDIKRSIDTLSEIDREYSSKNHLMSKDELRRFLKERKVI